MYSSAAVSSGNDANRVRRIA